MNFKKTDVANLEALASELLETYHKYAYTGITMSVTATEDGLEMNVEVAIKEERLELHACQTSGAEKKTIWLKPDYKMVYQMQEDLNVLEAEE